MQIIYIKRRVVLNFLIVFLIFAVSVIYAKGPGKEEIGAFLNNEKALPIYSVEVPDKRVALTFDAAWGNQYTQGILDALKRYNIKATFFVTGTFADRFPEMVGAIDKAGHEIGNHSNTHPMMTGLSDSGIAQEIRDAELKISNASGKKTELLRAPFGEYNNKVISKSRDMGYNVIQWDVDSNDWREVSCQDIVDRVCTKAGSGSIILFHNDAADTSEALPDIIENMRKEGYIFVKVSELLLKENYYVDNTGRQRPLK